MSHDLEMKNGKAQMAYVGQVPWHGLGIKVEEGATPSELLKAAGLDWTVSRRDMFAGIAPADPLNVSSPADAMHTPGFAVLMRDSDNTSFGPCGPRYTPVQNEEAFDFFQKFCDMGKMKMETAGSLKDGQHIWALAKLEKEFKLPGSDEVHGYLLFSVRHKWGASNIIRLTPIRVVCNNTIQVALREGRGSNGFEMPHVRAFDEVVRTKAEEAVGLSEEGMTKFEDAAQFMASKPAKHENLEKFILELNHPKEFKKRVLKENWVDVQEDFNKASDLMLELVETSPGANLKSAKGTWWGAVNAVTYAVDHELGNERDTALYNAWFGPRSHLKARAFTKGLEYAEAV